MLKQLQQLRTLLIALLVMAGAGNGWGQTKVTLTQDNLGLTGSSYSTGTKEIDGVTYVYTDLMKSNSNIQAKATTGTIYNKTPFGGDITSVGITHYGTARATTILGSSDGTNWTQVATGSGSITGDFSGKGYKYFKITRGSNAAYWTQIEVTYTAAVPSFTITAQSNNSTWGTVSLNGSIIIANPTSGYTYADPAYSVSPANSATVVQSGNEFNVTPSANTTVTINFAAIPTYTVTFDDDGSTVTEASGGAGVTLPSRSDVGAYTFAGWSETKVDPETTTAPAIIPAGSYSPTANVTLYPVYSKTEGGGTQNKTASVSISDYATENSWSNATQYTSVTLDESVTATADGLGNTGKYYENGQDWRLYQNESAKVTIATSSGALTSVTFSFSNSNSGTLDYDGSALTSGMPVAVSGTSAEFTVGNSSTGTKGQIRITAIEVNYSVSGSTTTYWSYPVAAAVECPVITVAENPFLFSTTATITCATDGAAIQYSYDNENWTAYTEPLTLTQTTTIYAKATKGSDESTVATVTATKNLAAPTVAVTGKLTLDLNGGTNVSAGTLSATVTYNNVAIPDAAVTSWESSDPAVATIDANGAVTLLTTGTVTFTATYAGNSDYAPATGTKTVTVVDSNAPGTTQQNPYTVEQALDNTPASGVFVRGIVSSFYENCNDIMSDGTNYRYYISDDGKTTSDQLLVYKGKGQGNVDFSSTDDLQVGDTVIITGQLTTYDNTKEFAAGNYIVWQKCEKNDATIVVNESETVSYGTTFSVDDTMIEGGEISLSSSNSAVATVDGLVVTPVAVGTTTITVNTASSMRYNAGSETFTLIVTAPEGQTTAAPSTINVFNETFNENEGTGGNDGSWSGTIATNNLVTDNEGWTFENGNGAKGCAKFGTGKKKGSATTPALGVSGTLTLSFRAAAWNTSSEKTTLNLSVSTGSMNKSSVELTKGEFNSYTATITNATDETTITLEAANTSDNRFFLDDVVVTKPGVALTAKFNASGYATYCSEYPLDFSAAEGYSAWQVTGVGGEAITFEKVTGSVKGGTGLLLMGEASTSVTLASVDSETELTTNLLKGTLAPTYVEANEYYGLSGQQFLKVNRGTVPAGKALLPASVVGDVNNVRTLSLVFVDPTTGIAETKTMEAEEGIYNLAGQRISKAQRGVNIIGGKKVLVK